MYVHVSAVRGGKWTFGDALLQYELLVAEEEEVVFRFKIGRAGLDIGNEIGGTDSAGARTR